MQGRWRSCEVAASMHETEHEGEGGGYRREGRAERGRSGRRTKAEPYELTRHTSPQVTAATRESGPFRETNPHLRSALPVSRNRGRAGARPLCQRAAPPLCAARGAVALGGRDDGPRAAKPLRNQRASNKGKRSGSRGRVEGENA